MIILDINMAEITTYVLIAICILLFVFFIKNKITRGRKNYPNGPLGFPIVGNLPFYGIYPPKTFFRWWQQYGDVFSIKLGSWNAVVVNGYSAIREVTNHSKDAFSGRPNFVSMELLTERIGEETFAFGNFTLAYIKQQKMATRALRLFTTGRPEIIDELVSSEAILFVEQMLKKCRTIPGYVEFEVQLLTLRFTYQLLYGRGNDTDIDRHVKSMAEFLHEFDEFTGSGSAIDVMPWLRYVMPWKIIWLRKLLSKIYTIQEEQVHEHYETFSRDVIRDVADAILASDADDESNKDRFVLSRARLNNTLADLLGAGFDTTNKTITWMLLYMTAYPDLQRKVHEEIDDMVKGRKVSLKDKKNLPFTEAVFLEVSRLVTQLPFSVPHYAIMDAKIGDFDVDEGTVVILNLHSVHHDVEYWGDPECFRPERFLCNDNTLDAEKCSRVIPFGFGRRRCVGEALAKMNVFMSFATVMQRCEFIKPHGVVLDLTPIPGLVYRPRDFRVLVKDRE